MEQEISDEYLSALKTLVLKHMKSHKAKVFLFGSRAKGTAGRFSDFDIGILPIDTIPHTVFADLRERIEESSIPYQVDVVDLSQTDDAFKEKVMSEGILWTD